MYGYGYPYGFYFDPTYILLIIGLVISHDRFHEDEKHFFKISSCEK